MATYDGPDITKIPNIMRKLGWHVGARFQDFWFAGASQDDPLKGREDSSISMDWILSFARAKGLFDTMVSQKIWTSDKAKIQIARMLSRTGGVGRGKTYFGSECRPTRQLDENYIQYATLGANGYYGYSGYSGYSGYQQAGNYSNSIYYFDPFDDLLAAIGRFPLRVLINGYSEPVAGVNRYKVTIESVGIYVRDSFDFNGSQWLGFWDLDKGSVSKLPWRGDAVWNSSYCDWRNANGKGGDFMVYSDVKIVERKPADVIEIQL